MNRLGRDISAVLLAPFRKRHYIAAWNVFEVYERPLEMIQRYLFGSGEYPALIGVRTPLGVLRLKAFTPHDVLTINEIFCRHDYPADKSDFVFVDFGSNIGISAAYFLSRNEKSVAYLFEPLPRNLERLKQNLAAFEGRYYLEPVAVNVVDGEGRFGWEETGRYGGLGQETGNYISVQCLEANKVLARILLKHRCIDVLKIDIETLEREITEGISEDIAKRIRKIYVEYPFRNNPLRKTHSVRQYSLVAQFIRHA